MFSGILSLHPLDAIKLPSLFPGIAKCPRGGGGGKPPPGETWLRSPWKKRDAGRRSQGGLGLSPQSQAHKSPREGVLSSQCSHRLPCPLPQLFTASSFLCLTSPLVAQAPSQPHLHHPSSSCLGGSTSALSASGVLASPLDTMALTCPSGQRGRVIDNIRPNGGWSGWIPALPDLGCVTLGKFLNLSEPPFPC